MIVASFGSKTFEVTSKKILTFSDFSASLKLANDKQKDDGGKPSTNTKGADLEKITLKVQLADRLGVSTRSEIDDWRAILESGDQHPLIIGGVQWGKTSYQLQGCNVSDATFGKNGRMEAATLSLEFSEWQAEAAKEKKSSKNKKSVSKKGVSKKGSSGTASSGKGASGVKEVSHEYAWNYDTRDARANAPSRVRQDDWAGLSTYNPPRERDDRNR